MNESRENIHRARSFLIALKADKVELESQIERNQAALYFGNANARQIEANINQMQMRVTQLILRIRQVEQYIALCHREQQIQTWLRKKRRL